MGAADGGAVRGRPPLRRARPLLPGRLRATPGRRRSSATSRRSAPSTPSSASGAVALVVHDWGGFVGLAWACEHPDLVSALVISDTGFFTDGRWHGMAEAMRGDQGEALIGALDRDGFAALLRADGATFTEEDLDAYWRPFDQGRGREATLEFYRSMDFEKLAPYEGKLGELGVPTLLLWGAEDKFAPIGGAHRFAKQIPGAKLVALEGAGHFVYDQERGATTAEVAAFLAGSPEPVR